MNLPRYARAAARLLRGDSLPKYVPSPAARVRSLSTIECALLAKHRRKRGRLLGAATAAATLLVVAVTWRVTSNRGPVSINLSAASTGANASVTDARGTRALSEQIEIAAGSSITASEYGNAVLRLSTGTRLTLGNQGRISVASLDRIQRFRLAQGALDVNVAKLKPGERFLIETIDATVEVRGTAFQVTVLDPDETCAGGARTRVRVTEGVVSVSWQGKSTTVRASSSWPEQCDGQLSKLVDRASYPIGLDAPRIGVPPAPVVTAKPHSQERPTAPGAASAGTSSSEPPGRAPLSAQNDEFERALRARQRGELQSALGLYREFLRQFPTSPLAENARVEVMRLLARSNKAAAARAAAEYLDRHPSGFATAEAERLVATP